MKRYAWSGETYTKGKSKKGFVSVTKELEIC